jgi:hypothetical protein
VESPYNPSRDHQREKRESPLVESPGKLLKIKGFEKRLTEKVSFKEIDLMFLDNGAKNVIV